MNGTRLSTAAELKLLAENTRLREECDRFREIADNNRKGYAELLVKANTETTRLHEYEVKLKEERDDLRRRLHGQVKETVAAEALNTHIKRLLRRAVAGCRWIVEAEAVLADAHMSGASEKHTPPAVGRAALERPDPPKAPTP